MDKMLDKLNSNIEKNNDLIDKMMIFLQEQSACKQRLDKEIKDKFFDSFISVLDRMLDNKEDAKLGLDFKLEDLYDDLNDFLQSHKLQYFKPKQNDDFDKKLHKVVKVEQTKSQELNMKIHKAISYGYKLEDVMLKKSKVIVYKFQGE